MGPEREAPFEGSIKKTVMIQLPGVTVVPAVFFYQSEIYF